MSEPEQPPSRHSSIVRTIHKFAKQAVFSSCPKIEQTLRQNSRQHSRRSCCRGDQVATSTAMAIATCRSFSVMATIEWANFRGARSWSKKTGWETDLKGSVIAMDQSRPFEKHVHLCVYMYIYTVYNRCKYIRMCLFFFYTDYSDIQALQRTHRSYHIVSWLHLAKIEDETERTYRCRWRSLTVSRHIANITLNHIRTKRTEEL